MPINKFLSFTKKFLKPFGIVSNQIHEATGRKQAGGGIPEKPAGEKPSADFRQVGKNPDDKSGFKVQHLGDKK